MKHYNVEMQVSGKQAASFWDFVMKFVHIFAQKRGCPLILSATASVNMSQRYFKSVLHYGIFSLHAGFFRLDSEYC